MAAFHWSYSQPSKYWDLLSECCSATPTQDLDLSIALAATSLLILLILGGGIVTKKYNILQRIKKFIVSTFLKLIFINNFHKTLIKLPYKLS